MRVSSYAAGGHLHGAAAYFGSFMKKASSRILTVISGFLLARAGIISGIYPFGAAFAAAAPRGLATWAVLGLLAGYIIPGGATGRLRYIATALAVAGIKWALAEIKTISRSPAFSPAAAFAGVILTGLVVSSSTGTAIGISMLTYSGEGLLAAASAFFLSGAAEVLTARGKIKPDRQQRCCCIVSAVIFAIPLCQITIFGFAPARVLLMLAVMAAAAKYREAGGAVAGVAMGLVLALSGKGLELAGISAAAGLMAALFSPIGAVMSAAAFSAVCSIGSLASGSIDVFFLLETLLASILFPLLKKKWLDRLPAFESMVKAEEYNTLGQLSASGRLRAAAEGLVGVSSTVCEVSQKLEKIDAPSPEGIYRTATKKICADCAIASFCWGSARAETTAHFDSLTAVLRQDGSLTRKTSPESLKKQCARWGEMTEEINRLYADFAAGERARRRISQVRSVIAEQLGGVSELLCELAEETNLQSDPSMAQLVRQSLEGAGYTAGAVRCVCDNQGRLTINAAITGRSRHSLQRSDLSYVIGEALGMEFLAPRLTGGGGAFTLELTQKPPLRVEFGAAQHCCSGERLCGDSYDALLDDSGGAVMLLSDGMGSGGRAAVDSAMTCGLLGRLLRAGFGIHGALRVVNSALLIKSDDESLSTADCLRMSLFTGEVDFCKAGAAQSFVCTDGEVKDIDIPSLPLGIMREPDCGSEAMRLSAGDVVLMVSDGAITEDVDWLRNELAHFDGEDPRALARSVVSLASARRGSSGDDDITALVLCCRDNAA